MPSTKSTKEQIDQIVVELRGLLGVDPERRNSELIDFLRAEHTRLGAQLLAETNQGEF
jgi:hypothetical protein